MPVGQVGGCAGAVADFGPPVVEDVGTEAEVRVVEDGEGEGEVRRFGEGQDVEWGGIIDGRSVDGFGDEECCEEESEEAWRQDAHGDCLWSSLALTLFRDANMRCF